MLCVSVAAPVQTIVKNANIGSIITIEKIMVIHVVLNSAGYFIQPGDMGF